MHGISPSEASDATEKAAPSVRDWLLAAALGAAFTLSVVDRYVLAYLVQDIQRDLGLSDLQIGLLQGFAFSLIFGLAGLPLGHLVDRVSRVRLVTVAVTIWSVMTLGCGLARSYTALLLCRAGVGVGEAAVTPASFSMLSQVFPPRYFFVASTIFSIGPVLAVSIAGALAALVLRQADAVGIIHIIWIGPVAAWRVVFAVCASLSIPLILGFLFLREPERSLVTTNGRNRLGLRHFLIFTRRNWRVHMIYCVACGMTTAASYALNAWMPAALTRDLGWTPDRLGSVLAVIALISGLVGCAIAGTVTTLLTQRGRTADLYLCVAIAAAVFAVAGLLMFLMNGDAIALPVLATAYLVSPLLFVLAPSLLQILTPPEFRGRMSALFLLFNVAIGAGLGPVIVGAISSTGAFPLTIAIGLTISLLCGVASLIAFAGRRRFAAFADHLTQNANN